MSSIAEQNVVGAGAAVDSTPFTEKEKEAGVANSGELAAKRTDYYDKWAGKARDLVAKTDKEEEEEKKASDAALGLDSAPKSKAEAEDRAKHAALKEAKKAWDQKKKLEEDLKFYLDGVDGKKDGLDIDVTEAMLGGKPVLVVQGLSKCKIVLKRGLKGSKSPMIKVFFDQCSDCVLLVGCPLLVGVDVTHCENCVLGLPEANSATSAIKTVQADLCAGLNVVFARGAMAAHGCKVFHAGVTGLAVWDGQQGADGSRVCRSDYKQLTDGKAMTAEGEPAEEVQFVTHVFDASAAASQGEGKGQDKGELCCEKVIRVGNHPTTRRELDAKAAKLGGTREEGGSRGTNAKIGGAQTPLMHAENDKGAGNESFKAREYAQAGIYYTRAIDRLSKLREVAVAEARGMNGGGEGERLTAEEKECLAKCLSNRAACWLKMGQPESALSDGKASEEIMPSLVKGAFRAGLALHAMKRYEEAGAWLAKALQRQPENKQIKQALEFARFKFQKEMRERMKER